jgi:hypothetical protein
MKNYYLTTDLPFSQTATGLIQPVSWGIHRVVIDALPVLSRTNENWPNTLATSAFSNREREERERQHSLDTRVNVKDTLHSFLTTAIRTDRLMAYGFSDPDGEAIYMLFYLNDVRLDLSAHTIAIDASVLPLTRKLVEQNIEGIREISKQMRTINTRGSEAIAWQYLLPSFVERCRTWKHKKTCEYLKTQKVPLTIKLSENPICSCGQGVDLGDAIRRDKAWSKLWPLMTRIIITPLFGVPWREPVDWLVKKDFKEMGGDREGRKERCASCGVEGSGDKKLLRCGACGSVSYCGPDCQKQHWKVHKTTCKKVGV